MRYYDGRVPTTSIAPNPSKKVVAAASIEPLSSIEITTKRHAKFTLHRVNGQLPPTFYMTYTDIDDDPVHSTEGDSHHTVLYETYTIDGDVLAEDQKLTLITSGGYTEEHWPTKLVSRSPHYKLRNWKRDARRGLKKPGRPKKQ